MHFCFVKLLFWGITRRLRKDASQYRPRKNLTSVEKYLPEIWIVKIETLSYKYWVRLLKPRENFGTKDPITWARLTRLARLVSVWRDLGMFCETQQKSTLWLHVSWTSPVSWDPGITVPGSWLTGLRFFHVIVFARSARLSKPIRVQNQACSSFPRFMKFLRES